MATPAIADVTRGPSSPASRFHDGEYQRSLSGTRMLDSACRNHPPPFEVALDVYEHAGLITRRHRYEVVVAAQATLFTICAIDTRRCVSLIIHHLAEWNS